jgi:hypothetical protein
LPRRANSLLRLNDGISEQEQKVQWVAGLPLGRFNSRDAHFISSRPAPQSLPDSSILAHRQALRKANSHPMLRSFDASATGNSPPFYAPCASLGNFGKR